MFEVDQKMVYGTIDNELRQAFVSFGIDPSCDAWTRLTRAMLVYQQWNTLLKPVYKHQLEALLIRLRDQVPLGKWGEEIVRTMTDRSISEVLRSDES